MEKPSMNTIGSVKNRINSALEFDGMTTAGGLALMDIALNNLRSRWPNETYIEFGAYKGRTAALIAQNLRVGDWLHTIESKDYLEVDRLRGLNSQVTWHKAMSEEFCKTKLPDIVGNSRLVFTHHDASHFFDNVETELLAVSKFLSEDAVIVLDDFNDSYSQVRAAYYFLRYARSFPFELILIGFNKAILVHESRFFMAEKYVLKSLLSDLEIAGITAKLVRTDNHERSRGFFVKQRAADDNEKHYGVGFFGQKFYIPNLREGD